VEVAGDPQPLGADRQALLLRLLLDEATCLVGSLLGLSVGLVELVAASGETLQTVAFEVRGAGVRADRVPR